MKKNRKSLYATQVGRQALRPEVTRRSFGRALAAAHP
jgi:hypothetical protein